MSQVSDHVERILERPSIGSEGNGWVEGLEEAVLPIFDQQPPELQPACIVHTNCGDGALLRNLYEIVITKSARGRSLDRFPLHLIGVDSSPQAVRRATSTLNGLIFL